MGFRVVAGPHVLDRAGYFAGRDVDRAGDLDVMLRDPDVRGIWFARGGYGTARLLDRIDLRVPLRSRKVLVGYSDVTALFAAASSRRGLTCLYGPVVAELGDPAAWHAPSLSALLEGGSVRIGLRPGQVLRHGRAVGPIRGGNLTVLAHLVGTRFAPDLRGAVLFLEDTGEAAYRIDRTLTHLRMAGCLDRVKAVLVGSLDAAPSGRTFPPDRAVREIVAENFLPLGVPVVVGLAAGHRRGKWTIPLGGSAVLDTRAGSLELSASRS